MVIPTNDLPASGQRPWTLTPKLLEIIGEVNQILAAITAGTIGGGDVASVAGKTGTVLLVPGDVGLGLLTNTVKAEAVHQHTRSQISDSTIVGRNVLGAADQTAGRAALGAGTSSLAIGTVVGTARDATSVDTYANATPGSVFRVFRTAAGTGPWPARPFTRTDIFVTAVGNGAAPTWLTGGDDRLVSIDPVTP